MHRLARGLGWLSIGLGLTEVLAARRLCEWMGVGDQAALIRAYGARELTNGAAILLQPGPVPARWMWARVAGDAMDLATLGAGLSEESAERTRIGGAIAVVGMVTVVDVACAWILSGG